MIDPGLKAKWVAALRSEEYAQGKEMLKRFDIENDRYEYCCLGVLACVTNMDWDNRSEWVMNKGNEEFLSEAMLSKVGLTHNQQQCLAGLNDTGASFSTIANIIEAFT